MGLPTAAARCSTCPCGECRRGPCPPLQALTFVVSMLHTVFDLLAFKNDIGFWKNNKSMEGLSARTVAINAFCQVG
jgi:hypothetical protein